jgi:hypothetical protein
MEKTALELFCDLNEIEVPETIEDDIMSIEVEDVSDIWILDVEDNGIEIFAPIEGIDSSNPKVLRALLEANYLGMATGAARIGVDPFSGQVSLCERWTVEQLLQPGARTMLAAFAGLVAGWRTEGIETLAEHIRTGGNDAEVPSDYMIKL